MPKTDEESIANWPNTSAETLTQSQQKSSDSNATSAIRSKKYLVFKLNDGQYAVPLSEVKEVIGLPTMVPVPGSPSYLLGLINLRGKVISAIDLKKKLAMSQPTEKVKRPATILVESDSITLGCVVDSIIEVLSITERDIDRTMEITMQGSSDYTQGVARFKDRPMILLLDLKKAANVSDVIRTRSLKQVA